MSTQQSLFNRQGEQEPVADAPEQRNIPVSCLRCHGEFWGTTTTPGVLYKTLDICADHESLEQVKRLNEYEQKQERRRERYEGYAENAAHRSQQHFAAADKMASVIPFGQPILVGHHSEGRDRRYRGRIHSHMDKGCEESSKATYFERRAASVGKGGVSSDDPAAIQKLQEQLEQCEAMQEHMREANKIAKSKKLSDDEKVERLVKGGLVKSEAAARQLLQPDYAGRVGFPDYAMTNNSANVRRIKARIEQLRQRDAEREEGDERAPVVGNGFTITEHPEDEGGRIWTEFDVKPAKAVCQFMHRQGWKWSKTRVAWVRHLNGSGRASAGYIKGQLETMLKGEESYAATLES